VQSIRQQKGPHSQPTRYSLNNITHRHASFLSSDLICQFHLMLMTPNTSSCVSADSIVCLYSRRVILMRLRQSLAIVRHRTVADATDKQRTTNPTNGLEALFWYSAGRPSGSPQQTPYCTDIADHARREQWSSTFCIQFNLETRQPAAAATRSGALSSLLVSTPVDQPMPPVAASVAPLSHRARFVVVPEIGCAWTAFN